MNRSDHNFSNACRCVALGVWALALCGRAAAQEVFREFTFKSGAAPMSYAFAVLDPNATHQSVRQAWAVKAKRMDPRPVALDLAHAKSAELSVEYWGGHIGTSEQRFKVNGHDWMDLPQPAGTPREPQRYYRTLHGNNAVPIPLDHLSDGENIFQFGAGRQIAYNFNLGFYWLYDFTVRVFYDASRPHPTGEILSPKPGAVFAEKLELEARASSPNGAIARVEFIGEYDDFDWDGDGIWREWQFSTEHGVLQHHLGTAASAPWCATWDARWLPDQSRPVRIRARITDATGITFLTPPVENLAQKRTKRSVRMFKSADVPERFASRDGKASSKCTIVVDGDFTNAKSARLVVSTWSASTDDDSIHELRFNGERLANRFGQFHNYSFNTLDVPLVRLKPGANDIDLYSTFKGHMIEINWPGPVLLVEFER